MAVKRIKNPLWSFLRHLLGSIPLFAALIFVSSYIVSIEWRMVVCFIFSVIFASYKYLRRHVKEKRKQNSGQTAKPIVYDADYHRVCESQVHLSRDHETSKRTISDLREEINKLKKDKDFTLARMTKKHAKELRAKEEKMKREKQLIQANLDQVIEEFTNKLNEANNDSLSLNGQLIQVQQQSDALTDHNRKLDSQLCAKELELSELQEKLEAYKKEVTLLEDNLAKRNEILVSLEDDLSAKDLELSQLQEEITASKDEVASLEEALNNKDHQIKQHEEALKTAIEHVMSDLDDLCVIHNESLGQNAEDLPSPTEAGVCLSTPERNDIRDLTDLSGSDDVESISPDHINSRYTCYALVTNCLQSIEERNYSMEKISYRSQVSSDIYPMENIPLSLEFSKYHDQLVAPSVVLPFPRDGN